MEKGRFDRNESRGILYSETAGTLGTLARIVLGVTSPGYPEDMAEMPCHLDRYIRRRYIYTPRVMLYTRYSSDMRGAKVAEEMDERRAVKRGKYFFFFSARREMKVKARSVRKYRGVTTYKI